MKPLHVIAASLCLAAAGCTTEKVNMNHSPNEQRHDPPDRIPANPEPSGISPVTSPSVPSQ